MSADNYYYVRKSGDRFAVTMEFASDAAPGPIDKSAHWFDSADAATLWAQEQYSEYGMALSGEVRQILNDQASGRYEELRLLRAIAVEMERHTIYPQAWPQRVGMAFEAWHKWKGLVTK